MADFNVTETHSFEGGRVRVLIQNDERRFAWALEVDGERSEVTTNYAGVLTFKGWCIAYGIFPELIPFKIGGTAMNLTALDLQAAKALLTPETWVNKWPEHGQHCATTALWKVTAFTGGDSQQRYIRALSCLLKAIPAGCVSIPHWNDAPGRTLEEVHAAFDAATEIANAGYGVSL